MPKQKERPEPKLGDPIPEQWLKEAERQLKAGYRVIVVPKFREEKDVELHIHIPDSGAESEATDEYTKAFNRLIKDDDLMTRDQMEVILKKKSIWGKEQEGEIQDIQDDMRAIELTVGKLKKKGSFNKASMNRYRISWKEKRENISQLLQKKNGLLSNTVEGRAEEQEIKAKLALCVKFADGTRVWNSLDELNHEKEKVVLIQALNESIVFWAGLTQEIIHELPVRILFGGEEESENLQEA